MAEHWVINASPVILLAKAEVIEFLPNICQTLVIPKGVLSEVGRGDFADAGRKWLEGRGSNFVTDCGPVPTEIIHHSLGAGEKEVIAWALAHRDFKAVLDDHQARQQARQLGIPILGTLKVLVMLKNHGCIPSLRPAIEKLRFAQGYFSPALIAQVLALAGE